LVGFYLLTRALDVERRPALAATAWVATSTFYLLMTRRLMTDIPLLTCALWCAALVMRGRAAASGVCAGLAVVAKGVAALPLLAAIYGFGLWSRVLSRRGSLQALATLLLVAAPWHTIVTLRHGSAFWQGYLGHHVAARLTSAVVPGLSWSERLQVWSRDSVVLVLALLGFSVSVMTGRMTTAARFALVWTALCALPLLASTTVLPHYFLPLVPALALLGVNVVGPVTWQHRLAPLAAAACVVVSLCSDPEKLGWWLAPDLGPDDKAIGTRLQQLVRPEDSVSSYNCSNAALVFYSGGLPISVYADDPRYLAIQNAVLMIQRQAGHAGAVFDLRATGLPTLREGRRYVVAPRGEDSLRAEQLLRAQAPARPLYRLEVGQLALIDDAGEGEPL
jgi:4-amino-4-deoxy-L-arabinose transferase-like glycosyltransferase